MNLFRGYVETRDKVCIEKFKNKSLKSYDEVKHLPEFAGILANDVILVDIDDQEQSEILFDIVKNKNIQCRVYETTRGKHFLFKNQEVKGNRTNCKLAIGLSADIKLGSRNSYSILKFKNKERIIIHDSDEIQTLPKWLLPVRTAKEFINMQPGDGRNQSLFAYIITLQSNDFSKEEARETIKIINEFVFKEPLSESELEIVLRDDAFKKPIFFKGNTFLHDQFTNYIKNNNHIVRINNQLHIYKDGVYVNGMREVEGQMVEHLPSLTSAKRNEVWKLLDIVCQDVTISDANLIAFRNGIYNLVDESLTPFSPDVIITNKIEWDYNPYAYSQLVDDTLNKISCEDKEVRANLEELTGYCLFRKNELGKAFILVGDASNGKSTFLDMVKTMLGDDNISSLDLGELGDRFKTAELFGKLANIGDDIEDNFIPNAGVFKKLVTGERISAERKGQDPFEFNNYSKMLFSANKVPKIKDRTGAIQRRLTIIPFDATFSVDDPDYRPYIKYELRGQECMEYLILVGLRGLREVIKNKQFTPGERIMKQLKEYEKDNNPILGFFEEVTQGEIENEPTKDVYKKYREYCIVNSMQPLSSGEFSKQVKRYFKFEITDKKINGKKYRIFIRS